MCIRDSSRALKFDELVFGDPKHLKLEQLIRWKPTRNGWLLLNTTGASKGNSDQVGGDGIIRDHRGVMLSAFMENCGHYSSPKA